MANIKAMAKAGGDDAGWDLDAPKIESKPAANPPAPATTTTEPEPKPVEESKGEVKPEERREEGRGRGRGMHGDRGPRGERGRGGFRKDFRGGPRREGGEGGREGEDNGDRRPRGRGRGEGFRGGRGGPRGERRGPPGERHEEEGGERRGRGGRGGPRGGRGGRRPMEEGAGPSEGGFAGRGGRGGRGGPRGGRGGGGPGGRRMNHRLTVEEFIASVNLNLIQHIKLDEAKKLLLALKALERPQRPLPAIRQFEKEIAPPPTTEVKAEEAKTVEPKTTPGTEEPKGGEKPEARKEDKSPKHEDIKPETQQKWDALSEDEKKTRLAKETAAFMEYRKKLEEFDDKRDDLQNALLLLQGKIPRAKFTSGFMMYMQETKEKNQKEGVELKGSPEEMREKLYETWKVMSEDNKLVYILLSRMAREKAQHELNVANLQDRISALKESVARQAMKINRPAESAAVSA